MATRALPNYKWARGHHEYYLQHSPGRPTSFCTSNDYNLQSPWKLSRLELAERIRGSYEGWSSKKLPIAYADAYNIGFLGLERFHPFDSKKFMKVVYNLEAKGILTPAQLVQPTEATQQVLMDVHTEDYLRSINTCSSRMAEITEIAAIGMLPNSVVQHRLNRPMRIHVAGTMLALGMALEWGWAINLGGGMHHASFDNGGGWCVYDDWTLALRKLRRETGNLIQKAMLIDLDVHQGNGHARSKLHFEDKDLYILDLYNADLWPWDTPAKAAINCELPMKSGTGDDEYLSLLVKGLHSAFEEFTPDIILYNAGTDILNGDPLGRCRMSPEAVAKRDEMVFQAAYNAGVPICMALSGGYAKDSAGVISNCIEHVIKKFGLISSSC